MAYTAEDVARDNREAEDRKRLAEEKAAADAALIEDWADFCREEPVEVGNLYLALSHGEPTGDIFKISAVIHRADPQKIGSGRYRMDYVGEASARELGMIRHLPLGIFETSGDPGDRLRK